LKSKTLLSLILTALFILPGFGQPPQPSAPVPDTKVVEGYGLSATEPDALTQAKRDAVEKGIGVFIISETETKNFMINKDVVITKTMGSVKKYEVISKGKTPDNLFEVKIKAEVSLANIKADLAALKILLESMDKPRVMVLIQEYRKGVTSPTYTSASTAVLDFLTGKEFNIVDAAQVAAKQGKSDDDIAKAASGDEVAAAKLGRDNGAEVIVVGKATGSIAPDNPMLGNMKSGQADINIKVINCQNAKVITAKSSHSAKPHISEETAMATALTAAGQKIMDQEIFEKIVSNWQDMANNGQELKVTLLGVDNFQKLKEVKNYLQGLGGNFVKVVQRSWVQTTGTLELDILYKGSSEAFSESLDSKKTTGGLVLNISDFTSGTVKIQVK